MVSALTLAVALWAIVPPFLEGGAERVVREKPPRARTWISPKMSADRMVRARLHPAHGLNLRVLARASQAGGQVRNGVGIEIRGRRAMVVTYKNGKSWMGQGARIRRSRGLETLEVVLAVHGQHLVASIYDANTGRLLSSLASSGLPSMDGGVGVTGSSSAALQMMSTRTACHGTPRPGLRSGPPVVAMVTPEHAALTRARGKLLERLPQPPPRVAWRTDLLGLEELGCEDRDVLEVTSELPWKWVDPAYLRHRDKAPTPTARGYKLDLSYKNGAMVGDLLHGWARQHPGRMRLEQIGLSHGKRPIYAVAVGNNIAAAQMRPAVFLNGGHHGDEPLSTEFVLDAIQSLLEPTDPAARRWLDNFVVWAVPMVNPDGNHAFFETSKRFGRKNGRDLDGDGVREASEGVDLNRNYPFRWGALGESGSRSDGRSSYFRGERAASEPETRAIIALAKRERFVAAVSYHTGAVAILAPYTIPGVDNPRPNEAWTIAQELARQLPRHPQDREFVVMRNLYAVDGTDQDWHRFAHGTLALLVEGGLWSPIGPSRRNAAVDAVRPTWTLLLDRFLDGPSLSGHVVDADGRPVHAEVRIREVELKAGERWTTRCRDGRFDRYLGRPGTYRVVVRARGHKAIERTVHVTGRSYLEVRLPKPAGKRAVCTR